MSTVWVHAAAGCAAIASWLYKAPSCHDSRLPGEEPAVAHDCGSSWTILILRMSQVSLRQGSSIPRALDMVGKAVGGDCGARMSEVGRSLTRGVPWADAWHAAMAVQHEGAPADSSSGKRTSRTQRDLGLLQSALESSWTQCREAVGKATDAYRAMFSAGIRAGRSHSGDCVLHDVNIGVN